MSLTLDMHYGSLRFWNPDGSEVLVEAENGKRVRAAEAWYDIGYHADNGKFVSPEHEPPAEFVRELRRRMGSDVWTVVWDRSLERWVIGYATFVLGPWSNEAALSDGTTFAYRPMLPHVKLPWIVEDPSPGGNHQPWDLDARILNHLEMILGSDPTARYRHALDAVYAHLNSEWRRKVEVSEATARAAMEEGSRDESFRAPTCLKEERLACARGLEREVEKAHDRHMAPARIYEQAASRAA